MLGHFCSGNAHGNTDVSRFQRRCVIDAVACHGDHVAFCLQCSDDSQLVRGRHPGVNGCLAHGSGKTGFVQRIEFYPGQRHSAGFHNTQIGCDARSRAGVVAGDHDHPDTGPASIRNGLPGFFSRWVQHADRADKDEIAFQCLGGLLLLVRCQRAVGYRQRPQCSIGQGVDVCQNPRPSRVVKFNRYHSHP